MKINKLDWDSRFFNLKIGEIFIENSQKEDINSDFDLIYVKQNISSSIEILGFEKKFQETKLIFHKILEEENIFLEENKIIDFEENPIPKESFYKLAYVSGNKSRFFLDGNFGVEKFKKLYQKWIDNSITKEFADKIFYTLEDEKISGFVTLQKKNNYAIIGLIAVDPKIQSQGIGTQLIKKCENYCIEEGIKELKIPTQKENKQACNFYQKLGYSIAEKLTIKHFWKS